ncbi:MAG: hypothetical protein KGL42_08645 [Betaproteobacteria bacterium]|nr:hypothetical protein [Betaproteobacteria bacterium]
MATLAALRDRANPMEPDRARAVAQVAGVLVDSARVEIEYLRITGTDATSTFLPSAPPHPTTGETRTGTLSRTDSGLVHRIKG